MQITPQVEEIDGPLPKYADGEIRLRFEFQVNNKTYAKCISFTKEAADNAESIERLIEDYIRTWVDRANHIYKQEYKK